MPQKYAEVSGVATLVHHSGVTTLPGRPPDCSLGRTILCLHDAGSNGMEFGPLRTALEANHSPIAFDLPGHGRSGSLDSLATVADMAAHARALGDRYDMAGPVLIGEGLGAAIALESAMSGWPAAVVLVGDVAPAPDELTAEIDQLAAITSGKARREFDSTGYAPDTPREIYQLAFGEWVKTDPRATLGARRAQADWDGRDRLGSVSCPALVVVGEHQETSGAAQALADALPDGRVVTIAGAGRHGIIEQAAELAALIDEFLGGLA